MSQLSPDKISLKEKFALFNEQWEGKVVAEMNGMYIKLARLQGEFLWHSHAHEDEMFHVLEGELTMRFRDRDVTVGQGECIVVPRGVEHMPICPEEVKIMLIEPKGTVNTGDADSDRRVEPEWI
ncbi:Cupin domain-containing protein [Paucidesulfovibrio gracilis DSM 16080]|uniref:Cupin domain-containing protein n=1 Tax=Paucidesulfovibrio gracilis DSM 16080 TaxID=1121449 RepID=A0A1T4W1F2_9BACT|nr:cupin domain-containing protein [Paucidesulfovibrio gracilis]SKA71124.1 Cupin domain-containing protein [Paucidesulfovibrio gracilis DSM 16080]